MKYNSIVTGKFIDRPNRFIAHVEINNQIETVHVKNTGRCKELLLPDSTVILEDSNNPNRKTRYDLIAVYKDNYGGPKSNELKTICPHYGLINIDSQAPNKVVKEWLSTKDYDLIKPEYTYKDSRIDFYMEKTIDGTTHKYLMEVKGCTLERDGIGYFPDAPTERGIKHLHTLINAVKEGYHATLAYAIQMEGINMVRPNEITHPAYKVAIEEAKAAGVEILYLPCIVEEDGLYIKE